MVVDNTVQWLQLDLRETGLPVGFEYFTTNPNIPAGSLPLQGGLYSRLAYPGLWEWVQKQPGYLKTESEWQELAVNNGGNVPFYSKGDGSTTFRVPALKCWVRGANSISEIGGYLTAGLPNITGTTKAAYGENNQTTNVGALQTDIYTIGSASGRQDGGNGSDGEPIQSAILTFNASKSNSIYGPSDTVQPPSIVGLWCVKAYGTITNVGSTDVSNIAQGLTNAETRISVLNTLVGAENNGGIVAALLEQNGYVKFSNGLILQWGKHARTTDYEQITFPISFTNVNYTCISTSYDLNSNADVASAYSGTYNSGKYPEEQKRTVSRFYVKTGSNAGGRDWIAIGQ